MRPLVLRAREEIGCNVRLSEITEYQGKIVPVCSVDCVPVFTDVCSVPFPALMSSYNDQMYSINTCLLSCNHVPSDVLLPGTP